MIICPNCGCQEPFDWKNSPHQLYMQYLNPEEAKEFLTAHAQLAAALEINQKFAVEGYYAFRVTKKGYLHRQPKAHCVNNKWTNYSSCYQKYRKYEPNHKIEQFILSESYSKKESI
jgi:hypothetical protein